MRAKVLSLFFLIFSQAFEQKNQGATTKNGERVVIIFCLPARFRVTVRCKRLGLGFGVGFRIVYALLTISYI